ncbi:MAG: hypothetical protein IKV12_03960 [Alistipes sp.]|nr:hypothetical protein [Alistipes sp.]
MIKRFFILVCAAVVIAISATAQTLDGSSTRNSMEFMAEKYDDKLGVETFVFVKGRGLETMKLLLRKEMGKDFLKGVDMIVLINYSDASNDTANTIHSEIDSITKDFSQQELPKEMTEGKNMRNFFKLGDDGKSIHDMIIIIEEETSKNVMYLGGVMKEEPSPAK